MTWFKDCNPWRVLALILIILVSMEFIGWQNTKQSYDAAQVEQIKRINELYDKEETLNLALEFGFDPMIVQITRQLSANVMRNRKGDAVVWRFVRTERELTYLLLSIVQIESRGDYRAHNPSGASGLTQLLFSTARQYDKDLQPSELFTIPKHLDIAVQHFVDLLVKYRGNYTLAVLAWNRGSGAVDRSIALGQSPENNYARLLFTQAAMRNAQ